MSLGNPIHSCNSLSLMCSRPIELDIYLPTSHFTSRMPICMSNAKDQSKFAIFSPKHAFSSIASAFVSGTNIHPIFQATKLKKHPDSSLFSPSLPSLPHYEVQRTPFLKCLSNQSPRHLRFYSPCLSWNPLYAFKSNLL